MGDNPRLLKSKDVAEMLQLSLSYVYQLAKNGLLPAVKIGGAVRYRPADIEEYLQTNTENKKDI